MISMLRCRQPMWSLAQQLISLDHLCISPVDQASSSLSTWSRDPALLIISCSNTGVWKRKKTNNHVSLGRGRSFTAVHNKDVTAATTGGKFMANAVLQCISLCDKVNHHMREGKNSPLRACLHGELTQVSVRYEVMCTYPLCRGSYTEGKWSWFTLVIIKQKQSKAHFISKYSCRV